MSRGLPEAFDAARLIPSQTQLSGRIELERFRRLAGLLAESCGAAEVELDCGRSADGRLTLEGRVRARLMLICQRCLEPLVERVEASLAVALVDSEAQGALVAPAYEPVALVEGRVVPLVALVEDELLLAVPLAPVHADRHDCGQLAERLAVYCSDPAATEEHKPFAGLAKLAGELHRRLK